MSPVAVKGVFVVNPPCLILNSNEMAVAVVTRDSSFMKTVTEMLKRRRKENQGLVTNWLLVVVRLSPLKK